MSCPLFVIANIWYSDTHLASGHDHDDLPVVSDTLSMSELAFYTLILRPATFIDGIDISPDGINFLLVTPRATRSNTVIVECNTLDAVLQ